MGQIPPFNITDEMTHLVAEIVELVTMITIADNAKPQPLLRKTNRIKTIQASLAIENNSLTLEQVTAILNGKHILGSPKEILEVKNAIHVYDLFLQLNPLKESDLLKAHRLMMKDLVEENGKYRSVNVGIADGKKVVHLAPPAKQVPLLMESLFTWLKKSKTHPLIKSCVFHYEFEFIHPFTDGNGRIGRMWQGLILTQWKPVFAWIPIDTMIKNHQKDYYKALKISDTQANSTAFIIFMLQRIIEGIKDASIGVNGIVNGTVKLIKENPYITLSELAIKLNKSRRTISRIIKELQEQQKIYRIGSDKTGYWEVVNESHS